MVKFIAYHGSQTSKLKMYENSALYFTTNYNQAKSYAKREWDEGLIEGQIPVVYKAELNIENPYKIKDYDEFMMDFTDTGMYEYFREELIEKGYDSAIYDDKKHKSQLIVIFYPSQYKILEMEKLPPSLEYYYNGELEDDEDINDYYYEDDYDDEIDEVLKRAGIQINEEKIDAPFQIPEVIKDNFKITNSLKDASKWKAKIIENNSNGDESIGIGDWNNIGYVMISLKDNTIIPIARADEHKRGYELLYELQEKYGINASDYYSVWCLKNSANYPYNKEEGDLLKKALIKCKSYGMDLSKSLVYMKYIDSLYRDKSYDDSMITAEDFINDNYQTVEKLNTSITNTGNKLIDAFKLLSESFSKTNIRGKYSIVNINKAIKNLYNVGSKIILKDNFKLVSDMDLEQMQEFVQQYKEGYYNNNQLSKVFFGFMGFRNNFHQRLRKNIDNKMLEKQLGSVEKIIEIIGSI